VRILKADLDNALAVLQTSTNNTQDFAYDHAYGGYRLVRENGAWEISPRLSKPEMYMWMCAYINGIQDGQKILSVSKEEGDR
jgi:hypothetical protein